MIKEVCPVNNSPKHKSKSERPSRPYDENCFEGTLMDWEARVFRNAEYFTVVRYGVSGGECAEVRTFPQALSLIETNSRALVYAVTKSGRNFCVPRSEWPKYHQIWLAEHK